MATITRTVTAAAGVFAPGHLGELPSTCGAQVAAWAWLLVSCRPVRHAGCL